MFVLTQVERRCVRTLLEVAEQQGALSSVEGDFQRLAQAFADPETRNLWKNGLLSGAEKEPLVLALKETLSLSKIVENFLFFLVERGLLSRLLEIVHHFPSFLQEHGGDQWITFSTAEGLSENKKSAVTRSLQEVFGSDARFSFATDSALLSGFKIQVGSKIADFSFQSRLKRLESTLKGADL
ncbi:MAG: ATP synthase F1 subunit delta [Holosporales bacterium]|nr:ATP synthase F1 subunit delta [Holosporales bacterium]